LENAISGDGFHARRRRQRIAIDPQRPRRFSWDGQAERYDQNEYHRHSSNPSRHAVCI
jgi:hypothetical protein